MGRSPSRSRHPCHSSLIVPLSLTICLTFPIHQPRGCRVQGGGLLQHVGQLCPSESGFEVNAPWQFKLFINQKEKIGVSPVTCLPVVGSYVSLDEKIFHLLPQEPLKKMECLRLTPKLQPPKTKMRASLTTTTACARGCCMGETAVTVPSLTLSLSTPATLPETSSQPPIT